jgi:hypothetical protein
MLHIEAEFHRRFPRIGLFRIFCGAEIPLASQVNLISAAVDPSAAGDPE